MSYQFARADVSQAGTDPVVLPQHIHGLLAGSADGAPLGEAMQLIRSRVDFEALEADWNALFDRAARPAQMFQSFAWLWHWANHFVAADGEQLAIVTIRRRGVLIGVLPLVVERVMGLRQLAFMGAPVSQYGDMLLEDTDAPDLLAVRALSYAVQATKADVVRLAKVRDGSVMAAALALQTATVTATEEALYIDLAKYGSFAAYEKRFSSKAVKNRRRLSRRLEEHGAVEVRWNFSGRDAAAAALSTLELKRVWLKARGQLSRAFADPRADAFFADVCAAEARTAGAEVALLCSGGEIANAAITVTAGGTQALHILAYSIPFEKCAPGLLHLEKLIARAFDSGVQTFDFLAPRHDYKTEWADGSVRVADYAVAITTPGKLYTHAYLGFAREHVKSTVKAAAGRLRGPLSLVQSAARSLRR